MEVCERSGKVVNPLLENMSTFKFEQRLRKMIYWLIEAVAKCQVQKGGRKVVYFAIVFN